MLDNIENDEPADRKLELMQSVAADKEGYVTVAQSHCSSYVFTLRGKGDLDDILKTGDSSSNIFWWLLCGASAAGIVALAVIGKRKKAYGYGGDGCRLPLILTEIKR